MRKFTNFLILLGIFLGVGVANVNTGMTESYNKYDFKYTYSNGNSYYGNVYCDPSYYYFPGRTWNYFEEGGKKGLYEILKGEYNSSYSNLYGDVFVTSFYDKVNNAIYTPTDTKIIAGNRYLGSEKFYVANDLLTASFATNSSIVKESMSYLDIPVQLNFTSNKPLTLYYTDTPGTASNITDGTGRDYVISGLNQISFNPGEYIKNLSISIYNDTYNEIDETLRLDLTNPGSMVQPGDFTSNLVTIIDDDRKTLADVKAFGAMGNGITDDTLAIQKAVDYVNSKGGGVVFFPTGTYVVTGVNINENITYQGEDNSIITRPAMMPKFNTSFTNARRPYVGLVDSKPLIVKNLIFDGNSQNQGPYENYELEHSNLLFLMGSKPGSSIGRLRTLVEDCLFRNGVSDGLALHDNLYATIYNIEADDVWRGGIVTGGTNLTVDIKNYISRGDGDLTGINFENTVKSHITMENLTLYDGNFDVGLDSCTLIGNNIKSPNIFSLYALNSTVTINNSNFGVGPNDKIYFPYNVTFDNCVFNATEMGLSEADRVLHAAPAVVWASQWQNQKNQNLLFKNCTYSVDYSVDPSDKVYGIYTDLDVIDSNNKLTVDGGIFSSNLDVGLYMKGGGNWSINNANFNADLPISIYGYINKSNYLFDVSLNNLAINSNKYINITGLPTPSGNKLTQRNIAINETANYITSTYGLEGNQYLGYRVIFGTAAPTSSTNALVGDIYQLKSDPSKKWQCIQAGYMRVDAYGKERYVVSSEWQPI